MRTDKTFLSVLATLIILSAIFFVITPYTTARPTSTGSAACGCTRSTTS